MRLPTKWTNGITKKEDKDDLRKRIESSKDVLDRLKVMLEIELESSVKEASSEENFSMPSWSEYQASKLGEQRALRAVIDLLPK